MSGFHLEVGDGHRLWVSDEGDPQGVPVVFLHGGPGSGCGPRARDLFDPARHRVIFIDQRGAGQSLPARGRHANTTAHLITDIETVRRHFGIESWMVVGGSWGATLALAYVQTHPGRVTALALRATFLGTEEELDWAFCRVLSAFRPDLHRALFGASGQASLPRLWRRILDPDPAIHSPAARAFYRAERALSDLTPQPALPDDAPLPATPFMEAHYFLNRCFLPENALLKGADRLAGIPGIMVQGRLDLLCPPSTSARLAACWPGSRVVMVEGAGHAMDNPAILAALRQAISDLT